MLQSQIDKLLEEGVVRADKSNPSEELLSEFSDRGLPVDVNADGVSLAEIQNPLRDTAITSELSGLALSYSLEVHKYIDSTNEYLAQTFKEGDLPAVCLAEYQLKGHGRRGNQWNATYGKDLCCSIAWPMLSENRVTGVASLIIALSLVDALEDLGLSGVEVKWPNDIFVNGCKIAGILIEQIFNGKTPILIVGVGLNLFQPLSDKRDFMATSFEEQRESCDRNIVAAKIIAAIFSGVSKITDQLSRPMMLEWLQHDYLRGKNITIEQNEVSQGVYQGIDSDGRLLLSVGDKLIKFSSGHITEILQ